MPNATSVAITDLRDPTAVGDEMELLDQDMISLDKKPFRVSRVALNLGPSALIFRNCSPRWSYAVLMMEFPSSVSRMA